MIIRHAHANGVARDFGVLPDNRKSSDRSVAEHAEVKRVVCVFPEIFTIDDQVLRKGLLEAGVEFVAEACRRIRRYAGNQSGNHGNVATGGGDGEVFVKRRFECACVGYAQDGVRCFDVVGKPQPRFDLVEDRPR